MSRVYYTEIKNEKVWVHLSKNDQTCKLRYYSDCRDDEVVKLDNEDSKNKVSEIENDPVYTFTIHQCAKYMSDVGCEFLKENKQYNNTEGWKKTFEKLEELRKEKDYFKEAESDGDLDKGLPADLTDELKSELIPQTAIRRLYDCMSDTPQLMNKAVRDALAHRLSGNTEPLIEMIDSSISHFERFNNIDEPFHNRKGDEERTIDGYFEEGPFAKRIVALLRSFKLLRSFNRDKKVEIKWRENGQDNNAPLQYIDYEISPYRKTGKASMEDGRVGTSGGGGIDLILHDGKQYIIGEVKAATDTDFFYALVQALTYTIELSTPNQMKRLNNHYSELKPPLEPGNSKHHVYVIFENDLDEAKRTRLYNETTKIAENLMENAETLKTVVSAIKFVKATLPEGSSDPIEFQVTDCFPAECSAPSNG
ncbi:hypothetical protein OAK32_01345 [Mariniblastus sp.]|nr:hypothetical protein [Mariniblastus sp.]